MTRPLSSTAVGVLGDRSADTMTSRRPAMHNDLVELTTVQGEVEEQQMRAFLEAHGIATLVRGEALRKTHAFVLDGLGAVEILIAPEDLEAARDLLDRVAAGDLELASEVLPADAGDGRELKATSSSGRARRAVSRPPKTAPRS
jgi:predicted deacylase